MKTLEKRIIKTLVYFLILCQLGPFPIGFLPTSYAEEDDTIPPFIQHIPISTIEGADDLVIQTTIHDESKVVSSSLYYREPGDTSYKKIKMKIKSGPMYEATIPKKAISPKGVEYYIMAEDQSGNIGYFGNEKSPYLAGSGEPMNIPKLATSEPQTTTWYKKWWVWTIIIAVAGGAAAAAGGGGGGSGNDNGGGTGNVTVTW